MSSARVAYPPPTHNDLTLAERTNLMRSSRKLGQVLGSTPRVRDDGPTQGRSGRPSLTIVTPSTSTQFEMLTPFPAPELHSPHPRRTPSVSSSTMSDDSADTRFSLASARSDADSLTSAESSPPRPRPRKVTRKPAPIYHPAHSPAPSLSAKPALAPIPASPPPDALHFATHAESASGAAAAARSLPFAAVGPPQPTFDIPVPSAAGARRTKMARLRRTLGDGVPARLVFPEDAHLYDGGAEEGAEMAAMGWQHDRSSPSPLPPPSPTFPTPSGPGSGPAYAVARYTSAFVSRADSEDGSAGGKRPGSSFSLQRPLFAVVDADDHVSGCFEFGMRRHRAAYIREFGRPRAVR